MEREEELFPAYRSLEEERRQQFMQARLRQFFLAARLVDDFFGDDTIAIVVINSD